MLVALTAQPRACCPEVSAEGLARIRYVSVSPASLHPETAHQKLTAHHHTIPLRIRLTMRFLYVSTLALAGTVAAAAAVALGTSAACLLYTSDAADD